MGRTAESRRVPLLERHHVPRPRLTHVLDEAPRRVVLTAPAGYGKTSLVAEWLHDKECVAWYRATPGAADVAEFSTGVADALGSFIPRAGNRLRRRLRVADAPAQSVERLAELLADDIRDWVDDAWLVIDDYHMVAESEAVDRFVGHLLSVTRLRLVVTTRRAPSWATARQIVHGEVLEITAADLAMTDEEVREVLHGHDPEIVRTVITQAHGWPVLIGLARLSTSLAVPSEKVSGALFRYFADEVLRREPEDVQAFMLAAAVPEAIDVPTLSTIPGLPETKAVIDRLKDEGLVRESEPGRLRFHPLLRDFLRRRLKSDSPAVFVEIARRAIESAYRVDHWNEAIELALEIGDKEWATEIVAAAAPRVLAGGGVETVDRWLALCGPAARERPGLVAASIEILVRRGQLSEAAALAYGLARRLPSDDEHYARAWYLAGHSALHLARYEVALDALARARETAKRADDVSKAYSTSIHALINLGASRAADDLISDFERVLPDGLDAQLMLAECKVEAARRTRTLAGLWAVLEPLVPLVKYASDPVTACVFLHGASGVATSRADYGRGLELAADAVTTSREFGLGPVRTAFSLGVYANSAIGLRRFVEAERALDEMLETGARHTRHVLADEELGRVRLLLARRRLREAYERRHLLEELELPDPLYCENRALLAIAAAALCENGYVSSTIERVAEHTDLVEVVFYSRFARLIVELAAGTRTHELQGDAIKLVAQAAKAEILDAFVIAYRAYPPLMRLIAEDEQSFSIVSRLARASNDRALAREAGVLLRAVDPREPTSLLTPREAEVFGLVRQGLSNAEIARRLFVSESTVKVHVHHILEKLGAKTRLEAVVMTK